MQLPGMRQAAGLRSPQAHARVAQIDLSRALALPGARGAVGPGEAKGLEVEPQYAGAAVAAVAADTLAQAQAALAAIDISWEHLDAVLDPEEAVARKQFTTEPTHYERGDLDKGLAHADIVVQGTYRTTSV